MKTDIHGMVKSYTIKSSSMWGYTRDMTHCSLFFEELKVFIVQCYETIEQDLKLNDMCLNTFPAM